MMTLINHPYILEFIQSATQKYYLGFEDINEQRDLVETSRMVILQPILDYFSWTFELKMYDNPPADNIFKFVVMKPLQVVDPVHRNHIIHFFGGRDFYLDEVFEAHNHFAEYLPFGLRATVLLVSKGPYIASYIKFQTQMPMSQMNLNITSRFNYIPLNYRLSFEEYMQINPNGSALKYQYYTQ